MDLFEAIQNRYSCRDYASKPVEPEKITQILEAARLAPSARNIQDWRFVVVTDSQIRQALQAAAANQPFVGQAPVVIAACSCTSIGSFKPQQVRNILNIPSSIEVVELMTLGYPADKGASPKRLELGQIACYEKWGF